MTPVNPCHDTRAPLIHLQQVGFTYAGTSSPVLQDLNLTIHQGDFVLVLGASGSGKSTLAMLLNGLIPHSIPGVLKGHITVDGQDTANTPVHELATRVGMVFQDPDAQIVNILVQDEVHFGMENLRWNEERVKQQGHEALQRLGIADLRHRNVMSLSGGQKQKVILASVLALAPKLLVLDEPTANLDPLGTHEVLEVIGRLNRDHNITVVMVENRVDELVEWINHVVLLENGSMALQGEPRHVYQHLHGRTGLWLPQVTEMSMAYGENALSPKDLPVTVDEGTRFILNRLQSEPISPSPIASNILAIDQTAEPLLEVKNLRFRYHPKLPFVLNNLSFRVNAGGVVAIVGQNGSGKTTLARLLVRIQNPSPQTIFLDGQDVRQLSIREVSSRIGYVFQNPDHQFVADTVYDELAFSLRAHGLAEEVIKQKTHDMLTRMALLGKERVSPFALSVGERRRLSVGAMLILNQRLVILDEPTIGQDPASSQVLMKLLHNLATQFGHTMLLITHDMRLVADWTQRTIVMNRGDILYDGPTKSVFRNSALLREAHLMEPPIAQVSQHLRSLWPGFPQDVVSIADMTTVIPPYPHEKRQDYGS